MESSPQATFFSIIIPVYNSSHTLERCLDSILNQDYTSFEVICIDDGSSDSSWDMLGNYVLRDLRIRRFSQSNSGPAAARNRGLNEATGEYIMFVDSDDYLYVDNALSVLNESIIANDKCEVVYYAGAFVSSDGVFPDYSKHKKVYDHGYQCMEENCLNSDGIVFGSVYVQCCKRSLIEDNCIRFDEHILYGEDRLFVCTLYNYANRTIEIPSVLYCYVVNNSSSLMNNDKRLARFDSDNRQVALHLDHLIRNNAYKQPRLRKYIHGLYKQSIRGMNKKEIDWKFVFRNASTLKLLVKDCLHYLGVFHY